MLKSPATLFLVVLTLLTTLGLAISLQGVLGINIGSVLNLGGNRITNLGTPLPGNPSDAATKGFVDSAASVLQTRVSGSCPLGQGIRTVNVDGTVACESAGAGLLSTDIVAAGAVKSYTVGTACNQPSNGGSRCDAYFLRYYTAYERNIWYNPRGVLIDSYPPYSLDCYETPSGSSQPCGARRTTPDSPTFSCTGGFVADNLNPMATVLYRSCTSGCVNCGCSTAICRLP